MFTLDNYLHKSFTETTSLKRTHTKMGVYKLTLKNISTGISNDIQYNEYSFIQSK